jgi:hypothetical protein
LNLIVTTCATLVPTSRYPTLRKLAVLCSAERKLIDSAPLEADAVRG